MRLRADGYADMRGLVTTFFVFTDGLDSFSRIERLPCKTGLTLNVHQVLALRLFVFLVSILLSGLLGKSFSSFCTWVSGFGLEFYFIGPDSGMGS